MCHVPMAIDVREISKSYRKRVSLRQLSKTSPREFREIPPTDSCKTDISTRGCVLFSHQSTSMRRRSRILCVHAYA